MALKRIKNIFLFLPRLLRSLASVDASVDSLRQQFVIQSWGLMPNRYHNPLTSTPRRYWSQSDEDGILEQILARTGPATNGSFLEFGVGNGFECNSLALLARGWHGAWVSGQEISFEPFPGGRLFFEQVWLTCDNIAETVAKVFENIEGSYANVDVVSMDLDGNDYHFAKILLESGLRPRVWIAEYNSRFPVGSDWVMTEKKDHKWAKDDYFGASISSFVKLFSDNNYFPVACSAQGSNIFFVENLFLDRFVDCPKDINAIYQPPLYELAPNWSHKTSGQTLRDLTRP